MSPGTDGSCTKSPYSSLPSPPCPFASYFSKSLSALWPERAGIPYNVERLRRSSAVTTPELSVSIRLYVLEIMSSSFKPAFGLIFDITSSNSFCTLSRVEPNSSSAACIFSPNDIIHSWIWRSAGSMRAAKASMTTCKLSNRTAAYTSKLAINCCLNTVAFCFVASKWSSAASAVAPLDDSTKSTPVSTLVMRPRDCDRKDDTFAMAGSSSWCRASEMPPPMLAQPCEEWPRSWSSCDVERLPVSTSTWEHSAPTTRKIVQLGTSRAAASAAMPRNHPGPRGSPRS
mmetsp:Transcript_80640/g.228276  ORF Transcript_80640/g.228276 Transcript_80640/m.228276 type:complete len:286 (+) Transcript_80640:1273-2130(+)